MAKIENVTRPPGCEIEHVLCMLPHLFPVGEQHGWIQIPLHSTRMPDPFPTFIKRNAPIKAYYIRTYFFYCGKECGGIGSEVNDRHTSGLHFANQFCRSRQNMTAIVLNRKAALPTIENLDNVGAGADLLNCILRGYCHNFREEFVPRAVTRIHHLLCIDVVA